MGSLAVLKVTSSLAAKLLIAVVNMRDLTVGVVITRMIRPSGGISV